MLGRITFLEFSSDAATLQSCSIRDHAHVASHAATLGKNFQSRLVALRDQDRTLDSTVLLTDLQFTLYGELDRVGFGELLL